MKHVVIKEYGCILKQGSLSKIDRDDLYLQEVSEADFAYLKTLVLSDEVEDGASLLQLSSVQRKEALKFKNYAGIIQTPSGTIIEILPKVYNQAGKEEAKEEARAILLKMLSCFKELPYKKSDSAHLKDGKIPLLEFFIRYYLNLVTRLVRYGIRSDYVETEDNLTYLKGKLNLRDHIRLNAAHRERFHVRFDEFKPDRPENRLIKSSLLKVAKLAQSTQTQKLCRDHLFTFHDIPQSTNYSCDFQLCRNDRNMAHYEEVMRWCRILLNDNSPLPQSGSKECISLLFPMERVFEDYVAAQLKKEWKVRTQLNSRHLVQSHNDKKFFIMKPDLELVRDDKRVIADTKWKLIRQGQSRYGISRSDLYQIYAYGHKYFDPGEEKEVFLIYPMTDKFTAPLENFEFESGFVLRVLPFDIVNARMVC